MKRWIACAVLLAAPIAAAERDQALGRLEKALPAGWSLLAAEDEVVIRHDRPVYCPTHPNGPLVTLELRFKLEAKWTPERYAEAKAANDKLAAELAAQKAKLSAKAYDAAVAKAKLREVRVPVCTLDRASIVERPDTFAQLDLDLDPAEAKTEGLKIRDLVEKRCPP